MMNYRDYTAKKEKALKERESLSKLEATNLIVNKNCIDCGACLHSNFDFLYTKEDGTIGVKEGTYITQDKLGKLNDICPLKAFSIDTKMNKEMLLKILVAKLFVECKIKDISRKDMPAFNKDEYAISIPYRRGEYDAKYLSYEAAERAGYREVNEKMFSGRKAIISSIVSQYSNKISIPYTTKWAEDGSIYAANNERISKILTAIKKVSGKEIGYRFEEFSVLPNSDDLYRFRHGIVADEMVSAVEYDYTLEGYYSIDTDYQEIYIGDSIFGNPKYKTRYYYKNLRECYESIAEDILWYIESGMYDIRETLEFEINSIIHEYNSKTFDKLSKKIKDLSEATGIEFFI